jgi:membrane associated rhomboid family serine protease
MLEHREYMRSTSYGLQWSATMVLLVVNVVAFLLQITVLPGVVHEDYLALSLEGLRKGFVWQLITFQLLHGGWLHLLLNCWALYVFGREVEWALGRARFLMLYFSSGVGGGLFQALVALLWPHHFTGAAVGASAGVLGVVAAFAMLYPDRSLTLLLFFIIPVSMQAKYLLWLSLLLAALGIAYPNSPFGGDVAHAAHLGGILTGLAFIRLREELQSGSCRWRPFNVGQPKREWHKSTSIRISRWPRSRGENSADTPSEEFISREVDPILDKISAHGIQSLTEHERKILQSARNKMAKR